MAIQTVKTPYEHDVQSGGTPMVPSSSNNKLGVVPVANPDGTPILSGLSADTTLPVAEQDRPYGEDTNNDAIITRKRSGWSVVHSPAANTQATATKAAGSTGIKHVARGIIVTFAAGATAPTAVQVSWALRDGATGAGNILAQGVISLPAVAGQSAPPIDLDDIWLEGSSATAMTLEFSVAGGANTIEAVTLIGEDII